MALGCLARNRLAPGMPTSDRGASFQLQHHLDVGAAVLGRSERNLDESELAVETQRGLEQRVREQLDAACAQLQGALDGRATQQHPDALPARRGRDSHLRELE